MNYLYFCVLDVNTSGFVGFTAFNTYNQTRDRDTRVKFDNVLLNKGQYYESTLASFTCRRAGVYFISINVQAKGDVIVAVIKGKTRVLSLYFTSGKSLFNSRSNAGIVRCEQGEVIQGTVIRMEKGSFICGHPDRPFTTFTVMVLKPGK